MSEKATYSQESEFSLVSYPYIFKFLIAPFLDLFYSNSFGKNKTYIVPTGFILSCVQFGFASTMKGWVEEKKIFNVTLLWFSQTVIITVFQIACEAWVFTLFKEEEKTKASVSRVGGAILGRFIAYNLFLPLNSVEFLNKYFFGNSPLTKPIMSHYGLMMFTGVFVLILTFYIWIFVEEKRIIRNENISAAKLTKFTKKLLFGKTWMKYFMYLFLSQTSLVLIRDSIQLKLIQNGIERAELATSESVTVILSFIFCLFSYLVIKEHQNMKRFHFANIYGVLTFIYYFYVLHHFIETKDRRLALDEIFVFYILRVIAVLQDVYVFAFLNNKIDEEMGATGITVLLCVGNAINIIPRTLGFKIIGIIKDYNSYAINCFILSIIGYVITWFYAVELDNCQVEE